ncbi:hypothetical protein LY78DRAFT_159501 [Colletotrichum sublineola]|nr:hypothetical protein LY78DRAFT_159501 [Colletotrichum sublineola]
MGGQGKKKERKKKQESHDGLRIGRATAPKHGEGVNQKKDLRTLSLPSSSSPFRHPSLRLHLHSPPPAQQQSILVQGLVIFCCCCCCCCCFFLVPSFAPGP